MNCSGNRQCFSFISIKHQFTHKTYLGRLSEWNLSLCCRKYIYHI